MTRLYSSTERFYHNSGHVHDCLNQLADVPDSECVDREAIILALWFHDAVYDAKRGDNEAASAELAAEWLSKMKMPLNRIEVVKRLIQITDHRSEPQTPNEALIVDIDLSILGRGAGEYDRYAAAIRQEYAHVPDAEYRTGRAAVLQVFLDRGRIFRTELFGEKYEAAARANVAREISTLERG